MKVNLKKIGAMVAGATILASSVAFAGLMYGNTVLVNDQGNTAAKVVVGEKALASDGVAAANIAAAIASNAWKSTVFTASVSGDPTCSVGGASDGAGACAISNEKAKLEISVPGSATPGTYTLKTLVGDLTDRTLLDRGLASQGNYTLSTTETNDVDAHPFTVSGSNTGLSGVSDQEIYKIGSDQFSPFQEVAVTDADAGKTYKEKQALWITAHSQYRDVLDAVGGRFKNFVYQVKFTQDQYGIPVCTKSVNGSWEYNSAACTTANTDATQNHKVKIKFLGSDWVITKLDNTGVANSNNETGVQSGGEINLAKESVGGIINVGECLDAAGGLKVCLDDIKEGSTSSEQSAIISIKDANGALLKQTTVAPGTTQTISTTGGTQVRVRVFKTAPGYTFGAKWADMSVISNELVLKDGDSVEVHSDRDKNTKWKVRLAWKNRDTTSTGMANYTDHLRSILIYRDVSDFFKAGEGYNLMEDPIGFKFTYKGVSSATEYDTLRYEFVDMGGSSFTYVADGSTATTREVNASYLKISTGVSGGFTPTVVSGSQVRILLLTGTSDAINQTAGNVSKGANTCFSTLDGAGAGGLMSGRG